MKTIRVRARNPLADLQGLLFLTQCLDELLFDHTDDSYKAPALNTVSRTLELQRLLHLSSEARLGKGALRSFAEELEWSVKSDPVLTRDQAAAALIQVKHVIQHLSTPQRASRNTAALLLILGKYFSQTKSQLAKVALEQPKEKALTHTLCTAFVSQAEVIGFSRRFIYHMTQLRLVRELQRDQTLDVNSVLSKFLACFDSKPQEFSITFIAQPHAARFEDALTQFSCSLSTELNVPHKRAQEFAVHRKPDERFLTITNVRARDAIRAREVADGLIDLLSSSVCFYCHDAVLEVSDLALVSVLPAKESGGSAPAQGAAGTSNAYVVGKSPDPMHCNKLSAEAVPIDAIKRLNEVLAGRHLADASTHRFGSALEYHRAALMAKLPENQLVDLWAGLEGLLPEPRGDEPRIQFFVANLLAPLTLTYAEKLLRRATSEIERHGGEALAVVNSVPNGVSIFEKLTILLVAKEFEAERRSLALGLDDNPLLRFRLWQLSEKFSSQSRTLQTLKAHRTKVKWHVERIYATRNSIMHNAQALPHLRTLVENLHGYIDTLLTSIAKVAMDAPSRVTIDAVLELLLGNETQRFLELTLPKDQPDVFCDSQNAWDTVFGRSNLLAPAEHKAEAAPSA